MSEYENISFDDFKELMVNAVREALPDDSSVTLQSVRKNNEVCYDALLIRTGDSVVSPAIYLEAYYSKYLWSGSFEGVVSDLLRTYRTSIEDVKHIDFERQLFENVRDKIVFKVVNHEMNRKLLEELPHLLIHDLAVYFQIMIPMGDEGIGSVKLTHAYLKQLKMEADELLPLALKNTQRIFPKNITSFNEYLKTSAMRDSFFASQTGIEPDVLCEAMDRLLIITDKGMMEGAGVLFYPGVAGECAEMLGGSVIFIPSSTNEWLALPETENSEFLETLTETINEVNRTQLTKGEILSYRYYRYPQDDFNLEGRPIE